MNKIPSLLLILMIGFVGAIEVEFDCPKSVDANKEFSCTIISKDVSGVYDVKVEILQEDKTVAKIWNEEEGNWKSAYYYLNGFLDEEEKSLKLIISEEGSYNGILKIRQGETREFFDFEIDVGDVDSDEKDSMDKEEVETKKDEPVKVQKESVPLPGENLTEPVRESTIVLNDLKKVEKENEVIYESKSRRVLKYLPYVFSLFLLLIIAVLLREKF